MNIIDKIEYEMQDDGLFLKTVTHQEFSRELNEAIGMSARNIGILDTQIAQAEEQLKSINEAKDAELERQASLLKEHEDQEFPPVNMAIWKSKVKDVPNEILALEITLENFNLGIKGTPSKEETETIANYEEQLAILKKK